MDPAVVSNQALRKFLSSLFQDGQPIERYARDFLTCCHLGSLDDIQLMDLFWSGLDDEIAQLMPEDYTGWTLEGYVNLALSLSGLAFTVSLVDETPCELTVPPEPSPLVAPSPEFSQLHVLSAKPESVHVSPARPGNHHVLPTIKQPLDWSMAVKD